MNEPLDKMQMSVVDVMEWLNDHAAHLRKMEEIGALGETELTPMLESAAALLEQLSDLAADAVAGMRYIEQSHGRLYGVGWDRVYAKADALNPQLSAPAMLASVEVEKLRDLCSVVYQVCGALDARVDVLDALSDASAGSYTGNPLSLLPYPPSEAWLHKSKEALASVKRGLEQARKGEFVDPPDLDEDEKLAAEIPD
jgi:hypothetical protein